MSKEKAIKVIEDLRDYAYDNWDDLEYGDKLDEIGYAVDLIKSLVGSSEVVGSAEIEGNKYVISKG